jgi:hypothetical protein
MSLIKVPKTPRKAFNPDRIASGLIQAQIQHLEAASGIYPKARTRRVKLRTERQSAAYIAQLTARIYERAGADRGPEVAVTQPPPPIAGTPTPTSTTRQGSAAPAANTSSVSSARQRGSGSAAGSKAGRRRPAAGKKATRPKGRRG